MNCRDSEKTFFLLFYVLVFGSHLGYPCGLGDRVLSDTSIRIERTQEVARMMQKPEAKDIGKGPLVRNLNSSGKWPLVTPKNVRRNCGAVRSLSRPLPSLLPVWNLG